MVSKSSTRLRTDLSSISSEIVQFQRLLLYFDITCADSISLFKNNISVIGIATNLVHYERIKYIKIDCHYIQKLVYDKVLRFIYILSQDQIVRHEYLICKLMLIVNHHQFEGMSNGKDIVNEQYQTEKILPTIKEDHITF